MNIKSSDFSQVSVYVLGLKDRFRGRDLIQQLGDLHLNPKIVWGIDKEYFGPDFLKSLVDQRKARLILGRELSLSEVSCALGHFEMYEEFLNSSSEWGLFLEDDIIIDSAIEKLLGSLTDQVQPIVLTLSCSLHERFGPKPFPFSSDPLPLPWLPGFKHCLIPPIGAFAYLLNRSAAEIAVHNLRGKKVFAPADFPFEFKHLVNFYASEYTYADLRNVESTIESDRLLKYRITPLDSMSGKIQRRLRVIFDYSGLGIFWAKHVGLSGRFYLNEKVIWRERYKRFRKQPLSKF